MPHTRPSLRLAYERLAELHVSPFRRFDDDRRAKTRRPAAPLAVLLTQPVQRGIGFWGRPSTIPAVLDLLDRYPSPAERAANCEKLVPNASAN